MKPIMDCIAPEVDETKMKIDFHPLLDKPDRFFIQISEFSFAAYPVQINHGFHCLPDAGRSPNQARQLRRNELRQRISQWLRWACGKPTVAPADGSLSREQAVP
jgi:hypothetical protein